MRSELVAHGRSWKRTRSRPRVVYLTYDGIEEPLGRSQVLPYLYRLAGDFMITLISFEKTAQPNVNLCRTLEEVGIDWQRLRYHKRPPVLSTLLDVLAGRRALVRASRRAGGPTTVHVRSYVPALIALLARRRLRARLLFDIRGFWADERVEGGIWRSHSLLYKIAKGCERRFFSEADAIVTLTHASIPQIANWTQGRTVPIVVIPTCVDLTRFGERPRRPDGPKAVWIGSVGTWYRFDLCAAAAAELELPLEVITRQVLHAERLLAGYPAKIWTLAPEAIPGHLYAGDIGLCLIRSSFSKTASAPIRFAEYLACGMPVLVTRGIGDMDAIVEERAIGAVIADETHDALAVAAARLRLLVDDPTTAARCRQTARELFDVDAGTARYRALYVQIARPS